jgi:hypothetical protein
MLIDIFYVTFFTKIKFCIEFPTYTEIHHFLPMSIDKNYTAYWTIIDKTYYTPGNGFYFGIVDGKKCLYDNAGHILSSW